MNWVVLALFFCMVGCGCNLASKGKFINVKNPGASNQDFKDDSRECTWQAGINPNSATGSLLSLWPDDARESYWRCMEAKGWKYEKIK